MTSVYKRTYPQPPGQVTSWSVYVCLKSEITFEISVNGSSSAVLKAREPSVCWRLWVTDIFRQLITRKNSNQILNIMFWFRWFDTVFNLIPWNCGKCYSPAMVEVTTIKLKLEVSTLTRYKNTWCMLNMKKFLIVPDPNKGHLHVWRTSTTALFQRWSVV